MRHHYLLATTAPLLLFAFTHTKGLIAGAEWAEPRISVPNVIIVEGDSARKNVEIIISLDQVAKTSISVSYRTKAVTANEKIDYIAAEGKINFNAGEMIKRINLTIIGEKNCEPDEKLELVLENAIGASIADEGGTISIVNDDCDLSNLLSQEVLSFAGNSAELLKNMSAYEVRFTHSGFTSFFGALPECPIRTNGSVVLTGILYGMERVPADDDIVYTGTLQLNIDMDICSGTGRDEGKLCGMRVIGSGPVSANLEIYFDQRGAYLKIENKSPSFIRSLTGNCDQLQMDEEKDMIPDKTIATIFNGRDLPMLTNRTLRVGRYVEDDGQGNITTVEVLRQIKK